MTPRKINSSDYRMHNETLNEPQRLLKIFSLPKAYVRRRGFALYRFQQPAIYADICPRNIRGIIRNQKCN